MERIPLCFGVGFLARGALEGKKREPEGITPCPSLSSFPCSAAPRTPDPPTPRLSSLWQRCEKERGSYKWTWEKEEVKGGGLLPEAVFVDCKMGRNHELLATISMVT